MKKVLIVVLLLLNIVIYSQQNITGYIIDTESNLVSNVNIYYKNNSKTGTISNEKGFFKIKKINDSLVFSHILFNTKYIQPDSLSHNLKIILTSKTNMLKEVAVNSNAKEKTIIKTPWVIDYKINKDKIFVAFVSNTGTKIRVYDLDDNILYEENNKQFKFFDTDCYNNLYFCVQDTFLQIHFFDYYYEIEKEFTPSYFEKIKLYCDVAIAGNQYFNYFLHTHINIIYSLNKSTEKLKNIYIVTNNRELKNSLQYEKNLINEQDKLAKEQKELYNLQMFNKISYTDAMLKQYDIYKKGKTIESDKTFSSKILNKKKESPLFRINDSLLIFNLIGKKLVVYANNKISEKNIIDLPEGDLNFVQEPESQKIYIIEQNKKQTKIYDFNSTTGKTSFIKELPYNIESPSVVKNTLYFLRYFKYKELKLLQKICLN